MAIWQYSFLVLPKESVEALSPDYHFKKSEDGFEDEVYWKFTSINKIFFQKVQKILPKNKSWSSEIDLYGFQESNCFEVLSDNDGYVLSVSFRIDFRSNFENILRQLIEFCIYNGLVILDQELIIVPGNFEQVQSLIEFSLQAKKYTELSENENKLE